MKKNFLLLLVIVFTKAAFAQQYVIKAEVTGFKNGTKFYLNDVDADTNIDSAVIQNNVFILKGKLYNPPQSLWVTATVGEKFYYFTLLIGNESIEVKGDAQDFPFDLSIKGSKIQDTHNELISLTREGYKRRNKLLEEYFLLKGDSAKIKGKAIWKVIGVIDSTDEAIRRGFVKTHLNTYEGLDGLFYLKDKLPKDSIQNMYDLLRPEFKQTRFGKRIATYLKVGKILEGGDLATDFQAYDSNSKAHHLSEIKGKYILLDFSTTYCGPCIESIEDLKKVSGKYAEQLSIITFSADGGKATWLKGINRDKPTWLSLWDGKGYYGETIIKYGVSGYPTFILIDPNGRIMSKWSGYGKEDDGRGSLETKLDKLMAKTR
jgi:thiol-disulfide isomerase/thioredoxin